MASSFQCKLIMPMQSDKRANFFVSDVTVFEFVLDLDTKSLA